MFGFRMTDAPDGKERKVMRIPREEQLAIIQVLKHGKAWGYGNMIAHLQTAWAARLVAAEGFDEESGKRSSNRLLFRFEVWTGIRIAADRFRKLYVKLIGASKPGTSRL